MTFREKSISKLYAFALAARAAGYLGETISEAGNEAGG